MAEELDLSILTGGQARIYVQPDGASPANAYLYQGCLNFGGLNQELGEDTPIYCPSPDQRNKFVVVGRTPAEQGLPTTDFTQHMSRLGTDIWWKLRKTSCYFNWVIPLSNCAAPGDKDTFDSLIIGKQYKLTSFATGSLSPLAGADNTAVDITGSLQGTDFDIFLPIRFEEEAAAIVLSEALDGIWADQIQCGDCGTPSDGCQKAYVLCDDFAGSPGVGAHIVHKNSAGTWSSLGINTLTGQANRLAQVGRYLVVISDADEAHHYKTLAGVDANDLTGWTRVATGYVASSGPRAIWSKSPAETFIAGGGGYVYFLANPTGGVTVLTDGSVTSQDLNDIHAFGRTVVAVGASNAVIASYNNGETWSAITGPAVGQTLNAIWLVGQNVWWVASGNGNLYYTIDGGDTWTEATPDGAITNIRDVQFVDEIVGYFVAEVAADNSVRVYRTADNGNTWWYDGSYIAGVPAADYFNFISPCPYSYNVALLGGLSLGSSDGLIAVGG